MTANTKVYGLSQKVMLDRLLALGTPKVMLINQSYVPNQDTDQYVNAVSANQASGTGYVAGGLTLNNVVTAYTAATNVANLDADDISGISVSCVWAVVYVDTGNPATSPVLSYTDLSEGAGTNVTVTGITWSTSGIVGITAA